MITSLRLPSDVERYRGAYVTALAVAVPPPDFWKDGPKWTEAHQPHAIAAVLMEDGGPHEAMRNQGQHVDFLFCQEITDGAMTVLGRAVRVSGRLAFYTDFDWIIEVNWTTWRALSPTQKIALIDHELCHCGWDTEKDRAAMLAHDVEEFLPVIRRWGLWRPCLRALSRTIKKVGAQQDLFPELDQPDGVPLAAQTAETVAAVPVAPDAGLPSTRAGLSLVSP